jgi:5'-nucleotidase
VNILVTNDDGISSPGLAALARAMRRLGDVWVVAPDRERNAVGHALTLHKPLRITRVDRQVFSINGTPTDCVNLALKKLMPRAPKLVISGINRGVNLGDDVTYSGTVSAALEGTIMGIPSIAVSQEGDEEFQFDAAAAYAARIARIVLKHGLPEETLLNVNVPNRPLKSIKGATFAPLSRRRFDDPIVEKRDPRGRKYYWIAGTRQSWSRHTNSDYDAVRRGRVAITPIHLDVTHHAALDLLRHWEPLINRRRPAGRG